jgi:hypothetical protein
MHPRKARDRTRGDGDWASAKVGFGKRDKLADTERSTRPQQLALALWRGRKPAVGAQAFDPHPLDDPETVP